MTPHSDRAFTTIACTILCGIAAINLASTLQLAKHAPAAHTEITVSRAALFDAARVLGNYKCGDMLLAERIARVSERVGVSAALLAAKISTESSCNHLAVSNKKAIGYAQILPHIWDCERPRKKGEPCWDFSKVNLLNEEENILVGATILKYMIDTHGMEKGVARYNGEGDAAAAYAKAVIGRAK